MRKYISKIAIIFMMAFVIGIGCGVSAKAAEDSVVGTHNLNNTAENSAKVGDQLKAPEKGWKRYDCTYSYLKYDPEKWQHFYDEKSYKGSYMTPIFNENESVKMKFRVENCGSFIIIGNLLGAPGDAAIKVNLLYDIDPSTGKARSLADLSEVKVKGSGYTFIYNTVEFSQRDYIVEIEVKAKYFKNNSFSISAIDIPEEGRIVPYEFGTSATLNKTNMDLSVGKTEKLTETVTPDNIKDKKIIWSSSDKSIATVDENGNVRALKEGNAVIIATVEGTDLKAECKVNVTKKDVPAEPSQSNAVLTITMTNGNIKSYNATMKVVNDFIAWYENRANGSNGTPFYKFDKTDDGQDFKSKTEYIIFDKISSFEVDER